MLSSYWGLRLLIVEFGIWAEFETFWDLFWNYTWNVWSRQLCLLSIKSYWWLGGTFETSVWFFFSKGDLGKHYCSEIALSLLRELHISLVISIVSCFSSNQRRLNLISSSLMSWRNIWDLLCDYRSLFHSSGSFMCFSVSALSQMFLLQSNKIKMKISSETPK